MTTTSEIPPLKLTKLQRYLSNPNLKRAGVKLEYTEEMLIEMAKCAEDANYFVRTYMKIVSLDEGIIPFDLRPYQENIVDTVLHNRFTLCKMARQTGKTTTMAAIILWFILFDDNFTVAILANKAEMAREILSRIQLAYENLPAWLQQGVVEWNKGSIELENGSNIIAASTSSSAVRGQSINLVYLDEFAFVPNNIQEEFFASVYPTISSGKTTRVVISSTPNGMNLFYKLWVDSEEGNNDYKRVFVHWSEVPGRDEAWKKETIRNTSERQFMVEFECEFLGSTNTLIDPNKLRMIPFINPIKEDDDLKVYKEPQKDHMYVVIVDTARGMGYDYSAFTVIDVSQVPYEIVATYRNNTVAPMLYPNFIYNAAKHYNEAYVLVEVNDIGQQVADIMHHELEYEFILTAEFRGRAGQVISAGFGGGREVSLGVRTTNALKRIGCASLKTIIESDKLIINDFDVLSELTTFIANKRGTAYEAEEGHNDDLVMTLVIFAWLTGQDYFKNLTDIDIRKNLAQDHEEALEEQLLPFGFIDNGIDPTGEEDEEEFQLFESGTIVIDWDDEPTYF